MKKILVVEDETAIANFMIDLIQFLGYDSRHLDRGAEVLSVAIDWQPDLITLDIGMPAPDGIAVLEMLKANSATKEIPVFVVSALVKQANIREKISTATCIFEKPLDTQAFVKEIQKIIGE